jgi:hypothetical protein
MTKSDRDRLSAKQRLRLDILHLLYKCNVENAFGSNYMHFNELRGNFKNEDYEIQQELKYLTNEGLITSLTHIQLSITHLGIKEVEHVIEFPDERTIHFPQGIVQHYHASVGVVQNGNNTAIAKD